MSARIIEAAQRLAHARLDGMRLPGLPVDVRPADEAEGYRVQDALHGMLTAGGAGSLAGHKIGCTTTVMQQFLGIDHPCSGGVFATHVFREPVAVPFDSFLHVGVETEIAVMLGRDLPPRGVPYTVDEVRAAVSAVAAAIEIVDDRWDDYKRVDTPTLIADDFFNDASVLGPLRAYDGTLDLGVLRGVTRVNGVEAGRGAGADVLGQERPAAGEQFRLGEVEVLQPPVEPLDRLDRPGPLPVQAALGQAAAGGDVPAELGEVDELRAIHRVGARVNQQQRRGRDGREQE